jgi:hypothetical protein
MSLMSMILAFAPAPAARLRPQGSERELAAEVESVQRPSGLKDDFKATRRERDTFRATQQQIEQQQRIEQQLRQCAALQHYARPQSLPNCAPGRHAVLARRDSGGLGQFLGPGFPGRL